MDDNVDNMGGMTVLQMDNPLLRTISSPVVEFDRSLELLVGTMVQTMVNHRGIGLSAIQIGVTKRVVIAYDNNELHVLVNPEFIRKLNRETIEKEGCLSIPEHLWRKVSRPAKCEVRYQNIEGEYFTLNASGMLARIVQHEMDHLDGILILDKPVV